MDELKMIDDVCGAILRDLWIARVYLKVVSAPSSFPDTFPLF